MGQKIFKYEIHHSFVESSVEMPDGARVLSIQAQQDRLVLWALVDPDSEKVWRRFFVLPTGCEVPAEVWFFRAFGDCAVF